MKYKTLPFLVGEGKILQWKGLKLRLDQNTRTFVSDDPFSCRGRQGSSALVTLAAVVVVGTGATRAWPSLERRLAIHALLCHPRVERGAVEASPRRRQAARVHGDRLGDHRAAFFAGGGPRDGRGAAFFWKHLFQHRRSDGRRIEHETLAGRLL